jgi:hypothetical protein
MASWIAAIAAVVAVVLAALALRVAHRTRVATDRAAAEAKRSADAAEAANAEARRLGRLEVHRQHDALSPEPGLTRKYRIDSLPVGKVLMATIELSGERAPRIYRVHGVARFKKGGTRELGLPLLLKPGEPVDLQVEHLPLDRDEPETAALDLQL